MARNDYEDTLSSISSSQNLPPRPKSRFQFNNSTTSSHGFDPNSTNTQHHTVSSDSQNSFNYFDPDDSAEQCLMSTDLDIERRKRKQAKRVDIEIRDTAKKYNRWSPRKEQEISINLNDNEYFPDFTGGSSQFNGTNNSSKLISKLAKLDQDNTPCRVPKPKLSERSASASKKNSRFNTIAATENNQPANTPRRVVKDIHDDHEFSLDLSHPVHNKENILPKQRTSHISGSSKHEKIAQIEDKERRIFAEFDNILPKQRNSNIPGNSKHEKVAQPEYNERQVLAEIDTLMKDSSIRSGRVAKAASPTFTMSTTVNGSFSLPEVQNITKLVDNTSMSLPKKIETLVQPTEPMGKEEVDIYRSIDDLQQQVAILLNERKERDSVISSLRNQLKERKEQDAVISSLKLERKEQDAIISSLENERKEKDNVISTLRQQNQHMAETIHNLEDNIKAQAVENGKMASAVSGSEAAAILSHSQNAEMKKAMAEISSTNEDLRAEVENMTKQRDMVLDRYKTLVERLDTLQRPADAETSQPKEHHNIDTAPIQYQKDNETLNGPDSGSQDGDEYEDDVDDTADVTMRPTMEPHLALKQIMSNVHNQIENLTAQHTAKAAELRALDKSKNLRLRRSIAESLKMLVDQISSHSDFLYRLKDVSYAF